MHVMSSSKFFTTNSSSTTYVVQMDASPEDKIKVLRIFALLTSQPNLAKLLTEEVLSQVKQEHNKEVLERIICDDKDLDKLKKFTWQDIEALLKQRTSEFKRAVLRYGLDGECSTPEDSIMLAIKQVVMEGIAGIEDTHWYSLERLQFNYDKLGIYLDELYRQTLDKKFVGAIDFEFETQIFSLCKNWQDCLNDANFQDIVELLRTLNDNELGAKIFIDDMNLLVEIDKYTYGIKFTGKTKSKSLAKTLLDLIFV